MPGARYPAPGSVPVLFSENRGRHAVLFMKGLYSIPGKSAGNIVQDPAGHIDLLDQSLAFQELGYLGICLAQSKCLVLGAVLGDADSASDLAVYLDADLDLGIDGLGFVICGPCGNGQISFSAQNFVHFLGDMRCEGAEKTENGTEPCAAFFLSFLFASAFDAVGQLHQRILKMHVFHLDMLRHHKIHMGKIPDSTDTAP